MHKTRARGLAGLAVMALLGLTAGCGSSSHLTSSDTPVVPGDTIGVTPTTITIGQISTITGPIPGGGQGAFDALKGYVEYVNSIGGIDGRQLELVQKDDALNCTNDATDVRTLASSTFASVGTFALLDVCEQTALKANPTYPDIQGAVLDASLLRLPNVTAPSPAPSGYQTAGALWLKDKFPQAITHTAALYVAEATGSFDNISKTYESIGYKYVYSRGIGLTETNFTSDVLRMKSEGVQIVDLGATDAEIDEDFLQNAAQQNFHPDAIIAATAYDSSLFKQIGATNADDLYMPLNFPMFLGQDLGTNPELGLMTTWMHKVDPGRVPDLYAVDAWAAGVLFVQALKAAGPDPTRTKLLAQLAKIHNFNADGLIPTADPGARLPSTCMVIVGVQGNQFVRLDPAKKGFECNGGYYYLSATQAAG